MKIIKGNLLTLAEQGEFDAIVHGCNCFNMMGAGIAREIRTKYPEAYEVDCQTIAGDKDKLGTFTAHVTDKFTIINAYTQYGIGSGEDVFEYDAFQRVLDNLRNFSTTIRYGFPLIGCGLAGGDKQRIIDMIDGFDIILQLDGGSATIVEFDGTI